MTQGHTISTHAEDVHVEVRLDGELVADARRPVMLEETGLPTAYYLPKDAHGGRPADRAEHSLPVQGRCVLLDDRGGWPHPRCDRMELRDPNEGAEDIEGHVAFFADRAEILVDGVAV